VQFDTGGEQRGKRRRERLAGADERRLEALELLAGDRALWRREHVVEELVGKRDARHEDVARAVLGGRDRDLARRRRPLAFPVGQQEVGERLVAADEHLGLRQHQLAEGIDVALLLVFFEPRKVRHVGHQRHVGVVREDLGDRADAFGRPEEADLPGRDRHVFEHAARLLDDDVGVQRVMVEDLGGVAHQH
jgi:hypothetical protein